MFERMMEDWMKFQQKMMPDMPQAFKNVKDAADAFKSVPNPMADAEKWAKFMENSIKFQRAYVVQQQAAGILLDSRGIGVTIPIGK